MNNVLIVFIELVIIVFSLCFISFIFNFLYPVMLGKAGEGHVKKELNKLDDRYLVINDLMINNNGKTSQIDHVIVSIYGIFVIETKQYNGYLKGNDYDKKWLQYSGKNKYFINNPVHQNYGHVMALRELLNIDKDLFIPIVCISSTAKTNIKSNYVVMIYNLISYINKYSREILGNYKDIYNYLVSVNITDRRIRKEHVRNIKSNI